MKKQFVKQDAAIRKSSRRRFFGSLATGAAAFSAASFSSITAGAKTFSDNMYGPEEAEAWFNQLTGKHKIVFDVTQPHEVFPFAWPRVFLTTNGITETTDKEKCVVVV